MRRPEAALHRAVMAYLAAVLTPDTFATTFPAGGGGKVRGAILKASGLAAGVPDIILVNDGRALWIELKAPKGKLSEAQGETHARLWNAGSPVVIARSLDDVRSALRSWSIPTRERMAA